MEKLIDFIFGVFVLSLFFLFPVSVEYIVHLIFT